MRQTLTLEQVADTQVFARRFAQCCHAPLVIYLQGDLGAGKTTWVQGFLQGMQYGGSVKSPTYTLVESYQVSNAQVHHFDLYRLQDPEELEWLGFREYFAEDSICLVEWPDKGVGFLPQADCLFNIDVSPSGARHITLDALTDAGHQVLEQLNA